MADIVLFRADRDGIVTAVFPELPGDVAGMLMTGYSHVGQHHSCSQSWYDTTRRAVPAEYRDLMAELEGLGYELVVKLRMRYRMQQKREENAGIPT